MHKIIFLFFAMIFVSCSSTHKKTVTKISPDQSGYVSVNGIEMYYEIYGSGQPLVLMHGGGSSIHVSFGKGIPLLAQHYKVIAFDEQNHGKTKYFSRELSFENTADDIAAALKILKIENAYFLGFSNGATTGMQLAIRHPSLIKKMVLGSGLYQRDGAPAQFWQFMKNGSFKDFPPELRDAYLKTAPEPNDLQKMYDGDARRMRNFKSISEKDMRKVKIPVLIMQNDQDVATVEHATKIMRLLPNGRLSVFAGPHDNFLGHVGANNDAMTNASVAIIEDFLKF